MSFLKSLVLAIIATLFLTYVFGASLFEMLDIDVYRGQELIEPLQAISVSALVVLAVVIIALAIVLSVFGTIIFITMLIMGAVAMVMIGVFWPILFIVGILWLLARDNVPAT